MTTTIMHKVYVILDASVLLLCTPVAVDMHVIYLIKTQYCSARRFSIPIPNILLYMRYWKYFVRTIWEREREGNVMLLSARKRLLNWLIFLHDKWKILVYSYVYLYTSIPSFRWSYPARHIIVVAFAVANMPCVFDYRTHMIIRD